MKLESIVSLIESGTRLGLTAMDIAQRLCSEHGGETLPTLDEFEAQVDALRQLPDLTPNKTPGKE